MTKWVPWNDMTDGSDPDPIGWASRRLKSKVEDEHVKVWRYLQTHWEVAKDLTTDIRQWYQQLQSNWEKKYGVKSINSSLAAGMALSDPDKPELARELVGVVTDVYSEMGIWCISDKTALAVLLATGDEKLLDVIRSKHPDLEKWISDGPEKALDAFEAGVPELEEPLALFAYEAACSGKEFATAKYIISSLESRGTTICLPYLKDASQQVQVWLSENQNDSKLVSYRKFSSSLVTTIEAIQHRLPPGDIG